MIPFIIEQMLIPGATPRSYEGVDLRPHEAALRALLLDAQEVYTTALDDWEGRAAPDRPKSRLEDNWDPEAVTHDYSRWPDEELDDWDDWWRRHYHRGPGNPGTNRTRPGGPPIAPLYPVYSLVGRWWTRVLKMRSFRLEYPRDVLEWEDVARANFDIYNPPGRFFLMIVQALDDRYTVRTCYGIQQTVEARRKRRRRNKP